MNRRKALGWFSRGLAVAGAAVVAVPGVSWITAPLRSGKGDAKIVRNLCELSELPKEKPTEFAVSGNQQDAWTLYPSETLGRVWLIRHSDDDVPPKQAKVSAFTTICPHLGCDIGMGDSGGKFYCPCHQADFKLTGEAVREKGKDNPSPRGMDTLPCKIVQDNETKAWWVQVTYERYELQKTEKIVKA